MSERLLYAKQYSSDSLLRNRNRAIQSLAVGLRNKIARVVENMDRSEGLDTNLLDTIALRGERPVAQATLTEARLLEARAAEDIGNDPGMHLAFEYMQERIYEGDTSLQKRPNDLARKIVDRIKSENGTFRELDIDLTDQDIAEIRELLLVEIPESVVIFDYLIDHKNQLMKAIERDTKFPSLYNSAAFQDRVENHEQQVGVFVFADIASFKSMNDEKYGYSFVDNVILQQICDALSDEFNEENGGLVSRFGGDEFMIYVPGSADQVDQARRLAKTIQIAMERVSRDHIKQWIERVPTHLLPDGSIQEQVTAIYEDLQSLHIKIGVTAKQEKDEYSSLKARAESQLNIAAEQKALHRFPTKVSTHDAVFSAE